MNNKENNQNIEEIIEKLSKIPLTEEQTKRLEEIAKEAKRNNERKNLKNQEKESFVDDDLQLTDDERNQIKDRLKKATEDRKRKKVESEEIENEEESITLEEIISKYETPIKKQEEILNKINEHHRNQRSDYTIE